MHKHTQAMRKIIMDDVFDQKLALKLIAHLDRIQEEIEMSKAAVTDREDTLQDRMVALETKHLNACNLLRDFATVVESDRGADYHLLYQYKDFLEK